MATLDAILAGKYPAKAHARRVAGYLHERGYRGPGVIYLEAQKTRLIEDNDEAMPFRYALPHYPYACSLGFLSSTMLMVPGNVVSFFTSPGACCRILI